MMYIYIFFEKNSEKKWRKFVQTNMKSEKQKMKKLMEDFLFGSRFFRNVMKFEWAEETDKKVLTSCCINFILRILKSLRKFSEILWRLLGRNLGLNFKFQEIFYEKLAQIIIKKLLKVPKNHLKTASFQPKPTPTLPTSIPSKSKQNNKVTVPKIWYSHHHHHFHSLSSRLLCNWIDNTMTDDVPSIHHAIMLWVRCVCVHIIIITATDTEVHTVNKT